MSFFLGYLKIFVKNLLCCIFPLVLKEIKGIEAVVDSRAMKGII